MGSWKKGAVIGGIYGFIVPLFLDVFWNNKLLFYIGYPAIFTQIDLLVPSLKEYHLWKFYILIIINSFIWAINFSIISILILNFNEHYKLVLNNQFYKKLRDPDFLLYVVFALVAGAFLFGTIKEIITPNLIFSLVITLVILFYIFANDIFPKNKEYDFYDTLIASLNRLWKKYTVHISGYITFTFWQ